MDLRYERTEEFLRSAVLELGKKKDIHSLTVSEISKKAKISRIAFYDHYENAKSLIETMENEMIEMYIEKAKPFTDYYSDPMKIIKRIIKFYKINISSPLINSSRGSELSERIINRIIDEIISSEGITKIEDRIQIAFVITGISGVFQRHDISDAYNMSLLSNCVKSVLKR